MPLVSSRDALRLAKVARRKGWTFTRFSDDEVVQHSIEEALMAKLANAEAVEQADQRQRSEVVDAERRVAEQLEERRRGDLR